ncbi:hypothetical protein C7120_08545 [Prevotella sp. oral taxon 376]|uniref:hypothetical protein n=1 Tax=Prevotella sp. oral taxon 376 TaxID=712466 RepID=UPI000D1FD20B|nr:hypothetical protein [Prevotella sp. oral taxon 376]PTL34542.1 hypothetical protein C7120_08545 [Prevotella sp. oral taxon 376]
MKATEQTLLQVDRAIRKIAQKFPYDEETSIITDIHLRVFQDSGEILAFDDEEREITRCVIEQWIENKDDDFYKEITVILRDELRKLHDAVDNLGIMKPYSFVLEDDDKESIAELYVADDDTIIVGDDLMKGLDQDLDNFLDDLLKDHHS